MLRTRLVSAGLGLALSIASLGTPLRAQVEHGGRPPSFERPLRRAAPTARMAPVRADLLRAADARRTAHEPLRFGEPLAVDLHLRNAGAWEELGRGDRVWRLRIQSDGAKSLALVFRRFALPAGAELYVYDDRRETVRGAYTELENRLDGEFAIRPARGEALTLEYFEPARARGAGELALAAVVHDYLDVLGLIEDRSGTSGSGNCQQDVACPLGVGWEDQIDAAVHVLALPAGVLCSGSLLNNTAQDGTLLVLSAAHCTGLTNAVFTFNFERPGCRLGDAPTSDVIVGATQLVVDTAVDVQLVRLNAPAGPQPFPVFLAGWDRSGAVPASTVLIHHPSGDAKKISLDDDAPGSLENFWRIRDWERGSSEGGSSGSPLFEPAGRFVGNLDSGSSSCQIPTNDDFVTRLQAAWPVLEPYLDPLGTAPLVLDGLDVAQSLPRPFAVTGMFPKEVEALVPGIARTVRVLGAGFGDATEVLLDGAPLDPERIVRGGHSWFAIDMPQLPLGAHAFTVRDGAKNVTVPFTVVPSVVPRYQAGTGVPGEFVFSGEGLDTLHADRPGHLHALFWSLSSVPSVHPRLKLLLGNGFTQVQRVGFIVVPAAGSLGRHHAIPPGVLPFGTRLFSQAACLSHASGFPLPTSGVQENEFQF